MKKREAGTYAITWNAREFAEWSLLLSTKGWKIFRY